MKWNVWDSILQRYKKQVSRDAISLQKNKKVMGECSSMTSYIIMYYFKSD
ncbi:hypothetical protein HMPREF1870_01007 [Bacteroidales bacterium KA00344]|nr:hypothetical protein HMPREF1870_01007 [Bacteroidales bacterium KA00344]